MENPLARLQGPIALLARLLLAQIFLVEGWSKISGYADVQQYMVEHGVPGGLLPLVIATEIAGGLCIAAGFLTRLAAMALAGFCILTALFFHTHFSDLEQLINFQKNLAMAGGFLALVAFGPGAASLDAWLRRRRGPPDGTSRRN
jgi:putative oxidoreductase